MTHSLPLPLTDLTMNQCEDFMSQVVQKLEAKLLVLTGASQVSQGLRDDSRVVVTDIDADEESGVCITHNQVSFGRLWVLVSIATFLDDEDMIATVSVAPYDQVLYRWDKTKSHREQDELTLLFGYNPSQSLLLDKDVSVDNVVSECVRPLPGMIVRALHGLS